MDMLTIQANQHGPAKSWKVAVTLGPGKAGHHRNLPTLVQFLYKPMVFTILGCSSCGKQLHCRQAAIDTSRLVLLDDPCSLTVEQQPIVRFFSVWKLSFFLKNGP